MCAVACPQLVKFSAMSQVTRAVVDFVCQIAVSCITDMVELVEMVQYYNKHQHQLQAASTTAQTELPRDEGRNTVQLDTFDQQSNVIRRTHQ